MEFRDALRHRRMVRNFTTDPIGSDSLDRILDAGRRAPSAGFAQGTEFLVLEGRTDVERFWSCTFDPARRSSFRWQGLFQAPVVVVPFANADAYLARYREPDKAPTGLGEGEDSWPIPFWLTDAAMSVENMLLAAVDEGLGALFFGIFAGEEQLRREFDVPASYRALGAVAVGHPAPDEPSRSIARGRKPADEVIHRNRW
jgi:nitroreductase